jgi:hypothetical protein
MGTVLNPNNAVSGFALPLRTFKALPRRSALVGDEQINFFDLLLLCHSIAVPRKSTNVITCLSLFAGQEA